MSYSDVYTVSYNCLDVFKTKREAQKFYTTCYHCSEGAEQQRYASILVNLNFSNLGKDNVSKSCDEIHIKLQGNKDKFITIKLDDYLSIDNTIKYYEELIKKASRIGIKRFIVHPSGEPISDEERSARMKYAKESLAVLAEIAQRNTAVIAVEDLPRSCLGKNSDEITELISVHENLKVCFDTNHLLNENPVPVPSNSL